VLRVDFRLEVRDDTAGPACQKRKKKRICRAAALLARYVHALRVDALGRLGRTRARRAVFGGLAPWLLHAKVLHYYFCFFFYSKI
jgi:hypothetical protein